MITSTTATTIPSPPTLPSSSSSSRLSSSSSSSSRSRGLLERGRRQSAKKKTSSSSSSSSYDNNNNNNNDHPRARLNLPLEAALKKASSLAAAIVFTSSTAFAGTNVTRFAGAFADPNHPGCPREITSSGLLRGYDPVPFEKGRGCRGRKVVTDDVFAYPGKTMRYWELKTKINKTDDEIFIDFDKKDGSGEKVTAKLNEKGEIEFPTGEVWKRRRGESFFP